MRRKTGNNFGEANKAGRQSRKIGKGQRRCRRKEDREETENKLGKKTVDGSRGRK